ncbi:MAG: cytochrome c [Actinomycetia bacterium]|nr:cytochrome c [Actinomycetes bacterium]
MIPVAIAIGFTAILVTMASPAFAQSTDEGLEIYEQSCARCHQSDGLGTPGVYPPLAGNPAAGDFDHVVIVVTDGLEGVEIMGVSYDAAMPSFSNRLSAEEIDLVAEYVVELSGGGGGSTSPTTTLPQAAGSGSAGESLFTGATRLSAGGTACIACHAAGEYDQLGGPGMAIDLNGIVQSFGQAGFVAAITDPLVPPMIAVFGDHPITDAEANNLAAYLETTSADGSGDISVDLLVMVGLVGFVILMLITSGFLRGPQDSYQSKLKEKLRNSR